MSGHRIGRRAAFIAAIVVAVELASVGFALGVAVAAPGLTIVVTVSVDGTTGMWAPAQSLAAESAAIVATDTTTPSVPVSYTSEPAAPEDVSLTTAQA